MKAIINYRNKLIHLLRPGIFCIINNRNKKVYIGFAKNMLKGVQEQLTMVQEKVHPCIPHTQKVDNVQVCILEYCNIETLRIRQAYWIDTLRSEGFLILNKKSPVRYRTRIRVDKDYNVLVELVNKRKDSIIVGVFKKVKEAVEYCDFLKQNNPIVPIVANNELTQKYLQVSVSST